MKFFIPTAADDVAAEKIYSGITAFAQSNFSQTLANRRIFSITFLEDGQTITAEVGKVTVNQEEVFAILDIGSYLICTPSQGVVRGIPAIVGRDEVISVKEFD